LTVAELLPEEGAAFWLLRERAAALTREQSDERDEWLQRDPENRAAYERAPVLWDELDSLAAHEEMRSLRRAALSARPARRHVPLRWLAAAAAGLVAVFVGKSWLDADFISPLVTPFNTVDTRSIALHRTAVGERSVITLKDGSVVALNTDSEIQLRFTDSERAVQLVRGQAYFTVAQDKKLPFVVLAGGQRVTALGTAFDVRLDRDRVAVVLVEGRVVVDHAKQHIELEAGERFVSQGDAAGSVASADVQAATSWRRGRVILTDTPLAQAVVEINRYRRSPILIGDEAVGALKISGTYRISEADRFPQVIAAYYPLASMARASGETVLMWRRSDAPPQ
jgi:transmembrane sensor